MKKALRVFICKAMHMQSKRMDTRSFSALFCGVNQVLQDSEASHAILADDFTRGKIISDADETLNSFDVRANSASKNNSFDGNERKGSDDAHLMIAEERRARHKLQAQFQAQLSEMGGKMDALTAAVGKMNEVLGKAILCAPETPSLAETSRSQIWHGYRPQSSSREYDGDCKRTSQDFSSPPIPTPAEARCSVNKPIVENSGRPTFSTFKTTEVSAKLGYPTSEIFMSHLNRYPHTSDDAYVHGPRTVRGLPVLLVRTHMHKLHTHLHKSTPTAAPCECTCVSAPPYAQHALTASHTRQASTAVSLD